MTSPPPTYADTGAQYLDDNGEKVVLALCIPVGGVELWDRRTPVRQVQSNTGRHVLREDFPDFLLTVPAVCLEYTCRMGWLDLRAGEAA